MTIRWLWLGLEERTAVPSPPIRSPTSTCAALSVAWSARGPADRNTMPVSRPRSRISADSVSATVAPPRGGATSTQRFPSPKGVSTTDVHSADVREFEHRIPLLDCRTILLSRPRSRSWRTHSQEVPNGYSLHWIATAAGYRTTAHTASHRHSPERVDWFSDRLLHRIRRGLRRACRALLCWSGPGGGDGIRHGCWPRASVVVTVGATVVEAVDGL